MSEQSDNSSLEVTVSNYYSIGNGSTYDKHVFTILVNAGGMQYSVDRSYVDFVDLHRRLKKKFPKCDLPELPLAASSAIEKLLRRDPVRRGSFGNGRDSIVGVRESLSSPQKEKNAQSPKGLRIKFAEHYSRKTTELDAYLKVVLGLHEALASDEVLHFLDEELPSMAVDPHAIEPISVHDILLINEPVNKITVRRSEDASLNVKQGQLVVWRFSTENYDIGFSVELNGEVKVSSTRYSCHEKPAIGTVEANADGQCILKWDNTYSKVRSKSLSWSARVVNKEDYATAKSQALDVQREKKKFEMQRLTLKRCCLRLAASISGVIHSSDVVEEHAEEEEQRIREMEDEIVRLQGESQSLMADLDNAMQDMDEIDNAKLIAEESRDQITGSWRFTASQLDITRNELKAAREENIVLTEMTKELRKQVESLNNALRDAQELTQIAEDSEKETSTACAHALEQADQRIQELETQLSLLEGNGELEEKDELIETCREEISKLNNELETEREAHELALNSALKECADLKTQLLAAGSEQEKRIESLKQSASLQQDESRRAMEALENERQSWEARAKTAEVFCEVAEKEKGSSGADELEQHQRLKEALQHVTEENSHLQQEHRRFESEILRNQEEILLLKASLEASTRALRDKEVELRDRDKQNQELADSVNALTLKSRASDLDSSRFAGLEAEISDLRIELNHLQTELDEKDETINAVESEKNEFEKEIVLLREVISANESTMEELNLIKRNFKEATTSNEKSLKEAHSRSSEEAESLRREIDQLHQKIVSLESSSLHLRPPVSQEDSDAGSPLMSNGRASQKPSPRRTISSSVLSQSPEKSEAFRLLMLLRAKEEQLAMTMQLLDAQSEKVADLSAEVEQLKEENEHLEKVAATSDERLVRFRAAASEISGCLAYWLSDNV